jgi:quercetin dioxygenase-like cupin family protein
MSSKIFRWSDLPRQTILDGKLSRTALRTDNALETFNWLASDTPRTDPHTHPFDQLVMIVHGCLNLEVDGELLLLEPGTAFRVPANVPHTGWPAGNSEVLNIDVFAPVREDYLFLTEHQGESFSTAYRSRGETSGFYSEPEKHGS